MFLLLLLLQGVWVLVSGVPPRCRLVAISRQADARLPDQVDCTCKPTQLRYIGNLNFLKEQLVPIKLYNRTVDISIKDCETLELELNFAEITTKNVNLRLLQTKYIKINKIR